MSTGSAGTEGKSSLENTEGYTTTGKSGSSESTTSLLFDEKTKAALDSYLTSSGLSKDAAKEDARAASEFTMTKLLESGAPGIASTSRGGGGYDSTTERMMQNDLAARASAAGSSVILDTIAKYSAAESAGIAARSGAVSATTGKKTNTTTSENSQEYSGKSTRKDSFGLATGISGSSGSVICTQLYRDGLVPEAVYRADQRYVDDHFCKATINGYRFWAVPFVYGMRANKYVYAFGKYFGTRWCNHCASHYIRSPKVQPSNLIKVSMLIGVPICFLLGIMLPEVKYYKLWKGS